MFGPVRPWDSSNNNTGENLRQAMAQNPYLHTMIQSGYYDGATKYFDAKYTMWRLDPSGRMKDRLVFKGYRSGHMMYLRKEDLKNLMMILEHLYNIQLLKMVHQQNINFSCKKYYLKILV